MTKANFRSSEANSTGDRSNAVLTSAEVRAVEARYADVDMMRRAGRAAFEFLRERTTPSAEIALVVGPGNNGGDALACAAELASAGYTPTIVMLGDPAKFGSDAAAAWQRVLECGNSIIQNRPMKYGVPPEWIVDGLFGIGLKRPFNGAYKEIAEKIAIAKTEGAQILALDVPSGIDADSGALVGDIAVAADHTITFIAQKPGLITGPALDYVGQLHLATLGLDVGDSHRVKAFDVNDARALMHPAPANAHKGTHGTLAIIGGANSMLGAALLASRAAMRMGAGKVKVGWLAEPFPQVDPLMPEVMMRSAAEIATDTSINALVVGCGMGVAGAAARALKAQLKRDTRLVLDADALNLIAESAELASLVQSRATRNAATIITPHPAEAARLLGASTQSIQSDRLRAAHDLAKGYRCIAVLKGAGTVISNGTSASINRSGNALLATAGTGDVLAGMIGALLAQGYDAFSAAQIGVALHGAAADAMRERGVKRAAASDVIAEIANL